MICLSPAGQATGAILYPSSQLQTCISPSVPPRARGSANGRTGARAAQYNQPGARMLYCLLAAMSYHIDIAAAERIKPGPEDTINITADQAWEDTEPDTVHFRGHFEMRSNQWQVTAEQATLRGALDAPDHVTLVGSPAEISLSRTVNEQPEPIAAQALQIAYSRETNSLILSGGASLSQGDNTLSSEIIEYDISNDRFRSRGENGAQMKVRVKD